MEHAGLIKGQCLCLGRQQQVSADSSSRLQLQALSANAPNSKAAVRLQASVIITSLQDITAQQEVLQAPLQPDPKQLQILGVCMSPDGTFIAAYSRNSLFVAAAASSADQHIAAQHGQLHHLQQAATLQDIKAAYWCPGEAVLAVCCKRQSGIHLISLLQQQQQQQQQQLTCQHQLLLPGPSSGSSASPRCAAWLPRGSRADSSRAAPSPAWLLAAWDRDLLLFTWETSRTSRRGEPPGGLDWQRYGTRKILAGWSGPVRAMTAAAAAGPGSCRKEGGSSCTNLGNSHSCIVLATIDAQLSVNGNSGSNLSSGSVTIAQSNDADDLEGGLQQQPAAAAADPKDAIVDLRAPAAAAAAADPKDAIVELRAPAAAAAAAANDVVGAAKLNSGGAAATANQGLLGSLMNISQLQHHGLQQPALIQKHHNVPQPLQIAGAAGAAAAAAINSSMSLGGACLCMLRLTLSCIVQYDPSSDAVNTHISNNDDSSSTSHVMEPSPAAAAPASGLAGQQGPCTSVLHLPHIPLPNLLAVHEQVVAVASTTGRPVAVLCRFLDQEGLQLLRVVELPLPLDHTADQSARLEGLLLSADPATAGASHGKHSSSSSSSNGGCTDVAVAGMRPPAAGWSLLPEVVALLACSQHKTGDEQPRFASFGKLRIGSSEAGVLYLARYTLAQSHNQQQQAICLQGGQKSPEQMQHMHGDEQMYVTGKATQQQQQQVSNQQEQQLLVVAALERLQTSMEQRLDAIHESLGKLMQRVAALEGKMVQCGSSAGESGPMLHPA